MVHLKEETLSELLDGVPVAGAEEHLTVCPTCQGELELLRRLRSELRELPELQPPADLWSRIEPTLPGARQTRRSRLGWPTLVLMQAAAMVGIFVIGLSVGRSSQPGEELPDALPVAVAAEPVATTVTDAMADVQRLGSEYDAALANLQRLTQRPGSTGVVAIGTRRLANLDMLVEAARTALSVEPADPLLNSYLFAALEERDAVLLEMSESEGTGPEVLWR
jgi:hypothetical protein